MTDANFASDYENGGYKRTIRRLMRQGLDHHLASELAQHAWGECYQKRIQLQNPAALRAWVDASACNLMNSQRRVRRVEQLPAGFDLGGRPEINADVIDVRRALDQVSPRYRKVLKLRFFMGYTTDELSHELNVSRLAASALLARAKEAVRGLLTPGVSWK